MQTDRVTNPLETFPPRPLTDGEREIFHEWIAEVDDILAFVSERRNDEPAVYRRIVIARRSTGQRLYLIRPPQGNDAWLVQSAIEGEDVARCATLRAALNFVKPARGTMSPEATRLSNLISDGRTVSPAAAPQRQRREAAGAKGPGIASG